MHQSKQQKDCVVLSQSFTRTRRRQRSATSSIKPTVQCAHGGITLLLPIVIILVASSYSSSIVASKFDNRVRRSNFRIENSSNRRTISIQRSTERFPTQHIEENDESDLIEHVDENTHDFNDEYEVEEDTTAINRVESPKTDDYVEDKFDSTNEIAPDTVIASSSTDIILNSTDLGETPIDDYGVVLVNSTITHYASDFESLINTTESDNTDDMIESLLQTVNKTDIDQPIGVEIGSENNGTVEDSNEHKAKTKSHAKVSNSSHPTNPVSNSLVSEPTIDSSIDASENEHTLNDTTTDNGESSYTSEIDETLRNKALNDETITNITINDNTDIITREEIIEGDKDTHDSDSIVENSSGVNKPDDSGLINNNFEDNKFDSILEESTLGIEPSPPAASPNGETNDNDSQLLNKINTEEIEFEIILISFGCISLILMIITAYQMSENPDGMYASICRFTIGIILSIWSFIRYPCCKPKISTGRTSRQSYGHLPLSTKEYGYNDPTLEIH
jgi:hypothetical protein